MTSVIGKAAEFAVDWIETYLGGLLNLLSNILDGFLRIIGNILNYPDPLVFIIILIFISVLITKRLVMPLFIGASFYLIYYMGYWESSMITLNMVIVSTIVAVVLAIPLGIWASGSEKSNSFVKALMDFMQTMPAFVYLIPAVIFFGLGIVPGVIATVIFAMPPVVRLTNLGIRQVPEEMNEVADAFGSTTWHKLTKIQLPIAMPSIMTGINQCIMLSLSMVVIAAMIGGGGLGGDIVYALSRIDVGIGFEAGLSIVLIAVTLDRLTQSFTKSEPKAFSSEKRKTKNGNRTLKVGAVAIAMLLVVGAGAFFLESDESEPITYAGNVIDKEAGMGLYITQYTFNQLKITGISDLNAHSDKLGGTIIGIDAGAGIMEITGTAIEYYDLNYKLQSSSEAGMLSTLDAAYKNKDCIVVTLWDPHWAIGKYDMICLDDDLGVYGDAESIQSWTRNGLLESDKDLADLLSRYTYSIDELNDLLAFIEDEDVSVQRATEMWLDENESVKNRWLGDLEYKNNRGHIDIGLVNWACAVGSSTVLMHLLEELGYTVNLKESDVGPMYAGLAYGHIDLSVAVWVPLTHSHYLDNYATEGWRENV